MVTERYCRAPAANSLRKDIAMSDKTSTEKRGQDYFSPATKDLLAKRSGYICAYPGCKRMTVAGSKDRQSGITLTGIAAHITAASERGPRYDPSMNHDERASERNGIWTCQIHGKFIDDNPSKCSVEQLRRWKSQHEEWVFDRVESGAELFNRGIYRLAFEHVGVFSNKYTIPFGRHNVLVGSNGSGKTTICQILSAFSGGDHWRKFNHRFDFAKKASSRSFIELFHQNDQLKTTVRLSPQFISQGRKKADPSRQRIHIEVNGSPSVDWPRSLFRVLHFEDQLYGKRSSDPRNTFTRAVRYLADALGTDEDLVWGSLREELFTSSLFGYQFRQIGRRTAAVLVPDGRIFYLPLHVDSLGFTELQFALLDISIKLISCARAGNWLFLFDSSFFQRMHTKDKLLVFKTLTEHEDSFQTLFCLGDPEDAEILKDIQSDKWINALRFGELTLHSFL